MADVLPEQALTKLGPHELCSRQEGFEERVSEVEDLQGSSGVFKEGSREDDDAVSVHIWAVANVSHGPYLRFTTRTTEYSEWRRMQTYF